MNILILLGRKIIGRITALGRAILMLSSALLHVPNVRKGFPLLLNQLYSVGV